MDDDQHDDLAIRSEARLYRLLEERMLPGTDVRRVDRRIWNTFGETWAVLVTDLANFAKRAPAFGIIHFLQLIRETRRQVSPAVREHDGVHVRQDGPSFRAMFREPADAVRCAVAIQRNCRKHNDRRMPDDHVLLTAGIGFGRLLHVEEGLVYGDELNAAMRLASDTAKAHEILLTAAAREAVGDDVPECRFLDLGLAVPGSEQNYRVKTTR